MVLWTPPHVGKYLNPIEIVWSIVKARARKLRPELRKNNTILKAELRNQLCRIGDERGILLNICLPSMRFAFAILKAVFQSIRVVHKRTRDATAKPILFAELYEACVEFGMRVGHEEVDEHADEGRMPAGIEVEPPLGLADAMLPQKIRMVRTMAELHGLQGVDEQRTRVRFSALTRLTKAQTPAIVDEMLTSDESEGEQEVGAAIGEVHMPCDHIDDLFQGCEVKAWSFINTEGIFKVTLLNADGEEEVVEVDPEEWEFHDVPDDSAIEAAMAPGEPPDDPAVAAAMAPGKPPGAKVPKKAAAAKPAAGAEVKDAVAATAHRRSKTREEEKDRLKRVRDTFERLKGTRVKCTCGTKIAHHGGDDKTCGLYDRGGFLRHMGFDVGVTVDQLDEVRRYYPTEKHPVTGPSVDKLHLLVASCVRVGFAKK